MLNPNTIDVLKHLDKKQLKRLGDFINSPFHNSIEIMSKIYDEVAKTYPDFPEEKLSYERMFKKIYKGKTYKEQTIRNLYSEFSRLVRDFITQLEIERNKDFYYMFQVEGISNVQCYDYANKIIRENTKKENKRALIGPDYFFYNFRMESNFNSNLAFANKSHTKEYFTSLDSKTDNLISFFFKVLFNFATTYKILDKINKRKEDESKMINSFLSTFDVDEFLSKLKKNGNEFTDYLKIEYLLYKYSASEMSAEQYYELKKLIFDNIDKFEDFEKIHIFYAAFDVIKLWLLPIDDKYNIEFFELAKLFCSIKIEEYESFEEILVFEFRSILKTAVALKEFEWAENFLNKYINCFKTEQRQHEMDYSQGILNFYKGSFEKSLEHFNKFPINHIREKIDVQIYYIMNYFELKAYEPALSLIASLRQLLRESKEIPQMYYKSVENSLKFFKELITAKEKGAKLDYAIFKEAKESGKFHQRQYILEKFESEVK